MPKTVPGNEKTLRTRVKPEDLSLIGRAAAALGKDVDRFVHDAALIAAEETLLDRTVIEASPGAYAEFLAQIDMPPQPNERLRKTMQTKGPWEE